ncbi:MAG: selenide, water dikinase SelD [Proteobacteria bacterium]|jgi:selenide,water dikinase|nr:selenide, water dikinase SelD [Pseudomonadota bacterium]
MRLTQTVQKGGCAAKVSAIELRKILAQVKFPPLRSEVKVDGALFDDAAIVQVTPEIAMVQTLDFFTPILDSPFLFGKVATTNALSDVYAMGGKPQTALAILTFPAADMDLGVVTDVLQGACEALTGAHCSLVGGHSVDDPTLKFGLSVSGIVHPEKIWTNSKAQVGDRLILTKALGTGAATAALKRSEVTEAEISEEIVSMTQMNQIQDLLGADLLSSVHAATDITGFGFAGHCQQMAKASGKTFQIQAASMPLFEKTKIYLEKGFLTKAHRTNKEYTAEFSNFSRLSEMQKLTLFDPQTSGGLFLSVKESEASQILQKLKTRFQKAQIVGDVMSQTSFAVEYLP